MDARIRIGVLAVLLLAGFTALAYYATTSYNASQGHSHGSPVNIGDDEGRLEHSRRVPDSILVACKRDPNQPRVYSKGRRAVGTHIYSVSDGSVGGGCNRNPTGTQLNQHWLEQGPLTSQVSGH